MKKRKYITIKELIATVFLFLLIADLVDSFSKSNYDYMFFDIFFIIITLAVLQSVRK